MRIWLSAAAVVPVARLRDWDEAQESSAHELTVTPGILVEKEFELNEWSVVHTTQDEKGWYPIRYRL